MPASWLRSRNLRWLWQRLLPWLSVALLVLIVAVPLVLFAWLVLFTDIFTVQAITVVEARDHTARQARQIINQSLANALLPHSIFFVPTEAMEAEIKSSLPQVRTVHITRRLPGTVKAVVQEKTPRLLLWSAGEYYFVDSDGAAYERASLDKLPEVVLPTVKNNDRGSQVTLGAPVLDHSFVSFLQEAQSGLPDYTGREVAEIRIPSLAAREVHFTLDNNWRVLFDATRSPQQQLRVLRQVLEENISDQEKNTLRHIDLRIPRRVYYQASELPADDKDDQRE